MKGSWGLGAVVLVAVAWTNVGWAQDDGVSREEFEALKARIESLEEENAELKADLSERDEAELGNRLDEEINTILANYQGGDVRTRDARSLVIGGEIRTRGTFAFGEDASEEDIDGGYTAALTRLVFAFEVSEKVTAQISADAIWTFGSGADTSQAVSGGSFIGTGDLTPNRTQLNLHEAWLMIEDTFAIPGLFTKTGRQEIHLGTGFQIGSGDWYEGYTHDAMLISYGAQDQSWSITALAATANTQDQEVFQANSAFLTEHDVDAIYALYATYNSFEAVNVDAYVIHVNADMNALSLPRFNFQTGLPVNGAPASHTTFGTRLSGHFDVGEGDGVHYNGEFAYQIGEEVMPGLDVEGWTFEVDLRFRLAVGDQELDAFARVLYASGPDGDETGYVPLFPDRHSNYSADRPYGARYGLADLMPLDNVISFQGGLIYQWDQEITLGTTVLYAEADEAIVSGDDAYGWEWDLWGRWQKSEQLAYTAGLALILPEDQGEEIWALSDEIQFLFFVQARLVF